MKIIPACLVGASCFLLASCGGSTSRQEVKPPKPATPPVEKAAPEKDSQEAASDGAADSGEVAEHHKVIPSWQYEDGTLSVALAYRAWPKGVEGFNITATDLATQKQYELNTVPLVPRVQKDRDLSGFVVDHPALEQEARAAFDRWYSEADAQDSRFTAAELPKLSYELKLGTYAMLESEPLSLIGKGVRCARKLPAGKYQLEVTAPGDDRIFGEMAIDTEKPLPFPYLLEFDAYADADSASIAYEFDEQALQRKVAFYKLIGRHKNGGADYLPTSNYRSRTKVRFSIQPSASGEDMIPTDYDYELEATDWFGNRHVCTKRKKVKIHLVSVDTGTNGVVDVEWKFPGGTVPDHLTVAVQRTASATLGNAMVDEPFETVGESPANALSHAEPAGYLGMTSVVYRLALLDQGEKISESAIQSYNHFGTFRPLPGQILEVETNSVDGVKGILVYPRRSPYIKESAYTITVQKGGGTKTIYPEYQHVRKVPIRLQGISRPGESYSIQIAEFAVLFNKEKGKDYFAMQGRYSPPFRLTEPE